MDRVAHSVLLLGQSGAGKSETARGALEAEGGGVILLAPGEDEVGSYLQFQNDDRYYMRGFDDPEFLPEVGLRTPSGLRDLLRTLVAVRKRMAVDDPPPWRVCVLDTFDGAASLVVNVALSRAGVDIAPKARSSEGAEYYTSLQNLFAQLMRALRVLKDQFGMHLIVASHVSEREATDTGLAGAAGAVLSPIVPGSFREQLPGIFNQVVYAQVNRAAKLVDGRNDPRNPRHFLQWMTNSRRPTKSRLGPLGDGKVDRISNEWRHLKPLLDAAEAAKRGAGGAAPAHNS